MEIFNIFSRVPALGIFTSELCAAVCQRFYGPHLAFSFALFCKSSNEGGKHLRNSCPSIATSPGLCPWTACNSPTLCYATLHTSGLRETTHATLFLPSAAKQQISKTSGHSQTCGTLRSKCRPAASTGPHLNPSRTAAVKTDSHSP